MDGQNEKAHRIFHVLLLLHFFGNGTDTQTNEELNGRQRQKYPAHTHAYCIRIRSATHTERGNVTAEEEAHHRRPANQILCMDAGRVFQN